MNSMFLLFFNALAFCLLSLWHHGPVSRVPVCGGVHTCEHKAHIYTHPFMLFIKMRLWLNDEITLHKYAFRIKLCTKRSKLVLIVITESFFKKNNYFVIFLLILKSRKVYAVLLTTWFEHLRI